MSIKKNATITLQIQGMHCPSCAMNIDLELEDIAGVIEAKTHYAKQELTIAFRPEQISEQQLITAIAKLGYEAALTKKKDE